MKHGFLRSVLPAVLIAAVAFTAAPAAAPAKTTFTPLGETFLVPVDMTPDGSKIVGNAYFGSPYFTWTRNEGVVIIGGGCGAGQPAISGDGNTIFGTACDENGLIQAAKWMGGTDWQVLGSVEGAVSCDADLSSGWDVDYDGTVGVGLVWLAQQCRAHAGTWDLVNGGPATDLGSAFPNAATRANTISGDGHVIAGWQDSEFGSRQGAIWIDGVEQDVLTAAGEHVGEVMNINFDGSVMNGIGYPYGSPDGWVAVNGKFTDLKSPDFYYDTALPVGTSADGMLAVGAIREQRNGTTKAVFWKRGRATLVREYLAKKGLAAGWDIRWLTAVSADGSTISGWGFNPDGLLEGFVIENFR